jgi:glutamate synthase (NADPH/NADH) small chain
MGDPKGFIKYKRRTSGYRPVGERVKDFSEVEITLNTDERINQAARCMDCGIPFCHWGCPVSNIIPEFQHLVYKEKWKEAYELLAENHPMPEFTGRVCPAPCEHSCVLNIHQEPVTIRENELAVVEKAFKEGYIVPKPPQKRSGKKVAVIGSGPAGLVAAKELNYDGHLVTVFEQDEAIGGLLRFGIPDFKLNKSVIDRRQKIMEEEGVTFKVNTTVGVDVKGKELMKEFDAIVLAVGAMKPRDLTVEGRELDGIHFAMDFLTQQNKRVRGTYDSSGETEISAKDKNVLVIGGGDTGSDCVGTSNRHGAKSVTQIEIMPKPSLERKPDNPWPYYGWTLKTSSSHEEGCERFWNMATQKFVGENGAVKKAIVEEIEWVPNPNGGRPDMKKTGKVKEFETDLVLLALGFVSPVQEGLLKELGVEFDSRGNVIAPNGVSTIDKVFAAGDTVSGASLVVRAMDAGRETAKSVTKYLS